MKQLLWAYFPRGHSCTHRSTRPSNTLQVFLTVHGSAFLFISQHVVGAWRKASLERENEAEPSSLYLGYWNTTKKIIFLIPLRNNLSFSLIVIQIFCWRYTHGKDLLLCINIHQSWLYTVYTVHIMRCIPNQCGVHKNRTEQNNFTAHFINKVQEFFLQEL
jgi:hypothetical protein